MKLFQLYFWVILLLLASCTGPGETGNNNPLKKDSLSIQAPSDSAKKSNVALALVNADTSYVEYVFKNYDLVNIHSLDSTILVDLRYADTSNFLKLNLYDGLRNAYFNCDMAIRVANAQTFLRELNPQYSLVVLDAARPLHIQQTMWDSTRLDTSIRRKYLAPPNQTSLHNYGGAVDVTIMDLKTKTLLDMGTGYDFFGQLSQPAFEWYFLKDSTLSRTAYDNRKLLRNVMHKARLKPITSEWWHFSMCSKEEAALRYKLIK